jgi:hypothetical protein
MAFVEDLKNRWAEMDEIDRKNFWIGVAGIILLIILFWQLKSTFSSLGGILKSGASYVNSSVSGLENLPGTQ